MEKMTSPDRDIASRPISQVQWVGGGGGGGGGTILNMSHFVVRKSSLRQIANYVNYPGEYRHKSGDYRHKTGHWEIRFRIWKLPDYPGELTALVYKKGRTFPILKVFF